MCPRIEENNVPTKIIPVVCLTAAPALRVHRASDTGSAGGGGCGGHAAGGAHSQGEHGPPEYAGSVPGPAAERGEASFWTDPER